MRSALGPLGGLFLFAVAALPAHAQFPGYAPRRAPDLCGPAGNLCVSNWNVYPCFPPVGGVPPQLSGFGGGGFGTPNPPTHPYAHGPRDYFMAEIRDNGYGTYASRPAVPVYFGVRGAGVGGSPAPFGP